MQLIGVKTFRLTLLLYDIDMGDDMNSVQALIRRAERDVAVIESVRRARESMKLIHLRLMEFEETRIDVDLAEDIQRLGAVLMLLGYSGRL